jgi:hypothetical protein
MVKAIPDWQREPAEELEGLTPNQSNAFCEMQADCKIIQNRSFWCGLPCGFVLIAHVFYVEEINLNRHFVVPQSLGFPSRP